jgi:pyruvate formate lyase activating enzyme
MIFNIQRYSTHDGPGIRTVIFMKGCSLGCRWCQNPESREGARQIMFDRRLCLSECRLCIDKCPHAIQRNGENPADLLIQRNAFTPQDYDDLTDYCPTQALTVCGTEANVEAIMAQILRDLPFYQRTGGGVTLSGGEPFMQPMLAQQLFAACKAQDLHTAVESCLHVPWRYIQPSLDDIDLFLADLKHTDEGRFYQWTDGSAKRVMDNFRRLATSGKEIIVRVPLIPQFNADEDSIKAIINFAADELGVKEIHFLPYHTMGMNKYSLLAMPYQAPLTALNAPELLHFAEQYAGGKGISAILRG